MVRVGPAMVAGSAAVPNMSKCLDGIEEREGFWNIKPRLRLPRGAPKVAFWGAELCCNRSCLPRCEALKGDAMYATGRSCVCGTSPEPRLGLENFVLIVSRVVIGQLVSEALVRPSGCKCKVYL